MGHQTMARTFVCIYAGQLAWAQAKVADIEQEIAQLRSAHKKQIADMAAR